MGCHIMRNNNLSQDAPNGTGLSSGNVFGVFCLLCTGTAVVRNKHAGGERVKKSSKRDTTRAL